MMTDIFLVAVNVGTYFYEQATSVDVSAVYLYSSLNRNSFAF